MGRFKDTRGFGPPYRVPRSMEPILGKGGLTNRCMVVCRGAMRVLRIRICGCDVSAVENRPHPHPRLITVRILIQPLIPINSRG